MDDGADLQAPQILESQTPQTLQPPTQLQIQQTLLLLTVPQQPTRQTLPLLTIPQQLTRRTLLLLTTPQPLMEPQTQQSLMARTLLSMPEALLLEMVPILLPLLPQQRTLLTPSQLRWPLIAASAASTFTTPNPLSTSIFNAAVTTSNPSTSAVVRPASATSSSSPNTTRNAAPELKANTALLGALAGVMAILV